MPFEKKFQSSSLLPSALNSLLRRAKIVMLQLPDTEELIFRAVRAYISTRALQRNDFQVEVDVARFAGLSRTALLCYQAIESSGNDGRHIRDIRRRTNLKGDVS